MTGPSQMIAFHRFPVFELVSAYGVEFAVQAWSEWHT